MRNRMLLIVLASLFAASCSITLPDTEFCADLGSEGAACFHTFSETERLVPQPEWDNERFGMICTQSASFAQWKATIEKLCRDTRCSKKEREAIKVVASIETRAIERTRHAKKSSEKLLPR